jgi:hypothetical protein
MGESVLGYLPVKKKMYKQYSIGRKSVFDYYAKITAAQSIISAHPKF